MKTVLLESSLHPDGLAILKHEHHIVGPLTADNEERRKVFATAHAIVIGSNWQIDDATLAQSPTLQVVGRPGIGIDNIVLADATRHGVCVVHTPDAPTRSTAEHAFTLLIGLAKGLTRSDRGFRQRGWASRNDFTGVELKGKTLGLVGLGRIGGTLARMAHDGFEMRVIAFDPFIDPARAAALNVTLKPSLRDVLAEADFVSLHSALTAETRGLIGKAELETMKPTAFLINCSRGPVIDEAALLAALRAGRIAGAGLDVYSPEPPLPDNPLLTLENVIVTPHIASHTFDGVHAMSVGVAEEVCAVLRGERPRWLANPEVWERRR